MRSASGLRHPASASCLGRHLRLAGRCPNNSSLFPPLAAVVVVAAEKLFLIEQCRSVCGRSGIVFSQMGWGRTPSVIAARCQLPRGGSLWREGKLSGFAKGPILEGAVCVADWGSLLCGKLPSPRGRQPSQSSRFARCQLPRRGSFFHLPVSTNKAPPSGELANECEPERVRSSRPITPQPLPSPARPEPTPASARPAPWRWWRR